MSGQSLAIDQKRICKDCGIILTMKNWSPSSVEKHTYRCKSCVNVRNKAYRKTHYEERKAYNKTYHEGHREQERAYSVIHHEERLARQKIYNDTHRKEHKAYYENPENSERIWANTTIRSHKRDGYAVEFGADWLGQIAKNTPKCSIGNHEMSYKRGGRDQKRPMIIPTLDRMNNENVLTKENVWIICKFHNTMKNDMSLNEWIGECQRIWNNRTSIKSAIEDQHRFLTSDVLIKNIIKRRKSRGSLKDHRRSGYTILPDVTVEKLESLMGYVKKCLMCGVEINYEGTWPNGQSIDVLDGTHNMELENIALICRQCNIKKGNLSLDAYVEECQKVSMMNTHSKFLAV